MPPKKEGATKTAKGKGALASAAVGKAAATTGKQKRATPAERAAALQSVPKKNQADAERENPMSEKRLKEMMEAPLPQAASSEERQVDNPAGATATALVVVEDGNAAIAGSKRGVSQIGADEDDAVDHDGVDEVMDDANKGGETAPAKKKQAVADGDQSSSNGAGGGGAGGGGAGGGGGNSINTSSNNVTVVVTNNNSNSSPAVPEVLRPFHPSLPQLDTRALDAAKVHKKCKKYEEKMDQFVLSVGKYFRNQRFGAAASDDAVIPDYLHNLKPKPPTESGDDAERIFKKWKKYADGMSHFLCSVMSIHISNNNNGAGGGQQQQQPQAQVKRSHKKQNKTATEPKAAAASPGIKMFPGLTQEQCEVVMKLKKIYEALFYTLPYWDLDPTSSTWAELQAKYGDLLSPNVRTCLTSEIQSSRGSLFAKGAPFRGLVEKDANGVYCGGVKLLEAVNKIFPSPIEYLRTDTEADGSSKTEQTPTPMMYAIAILATKPPPEKKDQFKAKQPELTTLVDEIASTAATYRQNPEVLTPSLRGVTLDQHGWDASKVRFLAKLKLALLHKG